MNFEAEMKKVLKDGEILIGEKSIKKALLTGGVKMVIISKGAAQSTKEDFKRYSDLSGIKYWEYPENTKELGYVCAKPFPVACIAIVKEGSSKILEP